MTLEPCQNCGANSSRRIFEKSIDANGNIQTIVYCPECPKSEAPAKNFPALIVKRGRPRTRPLVEALNKSRGLLNGKIPDQDNELTRFRDATDRQRTSISFGADFRDPNRKAAAMESYVDKKFDARYGRGRWNRVKIDGGIIHKAEAVN